MSTVVHGAAGRRISRRRRRGHRQGAGKSHVSNMIDSVSDLQEQTSFSEYFESRLLNLPAELRTHIWRYVLGDRLVHIICPKHNKRSFCHTICDGRLRRKLSETDVARQFHEDDPCDEPATEPNEEYMRTSRYRHHQCYLTLKLAERHSRSDLGAESDSETREFSEGYVPKSRRRKLALVKPRCEVLSTDLLLVCHSVYDEALRILYGTNTFSFKHGGAMLELMRAVPRDSWRLVRRLHLDVDVNKHDLHVDSILPPYQLAEQLQIRHDRLENLAKAWCTAINPDTVRMLRSLRILHLCVRVVQCHQGYCYGCSRIDPVLQGPDEAWESNKVTTNHHLAKYRERCLGFLTRLKALEKLRTVTVTVHKYWLEKTAKEKRTAQRLPITALWLKDAILDAHGRGQYLEEMRERCWDSHEIAKTRSSIVTDDHAISKLRRELYALEQKNATRKIDYARRLVMHERRYGTKDDGSAHRTTKWLEAGCDSDDSAEWTDSWDELDYEERPAGEQRQ
jgi:hypothetical protein